MNDKTLVERLNILIKDDHENWCQGSYFLCTCGYDNDCSQAMQYAKSRIEALEAALRECATAYNGYAAQIIAKQALESKP